MAGTASSNFKWGPGGAYKAPPGEPLKAPASLPEADELQDEFAEVESPETDEVTDEPEADELQDDVVAQPKHRKVK